MSGIFDEVVPPERLAFTTVARDHDGNPLLEGYTTVTFENVGGRTKLAVRSRATGIAPQMLAGHGGGLDAEPRAA